MGIHLRRVAGVLPHRHRYRKARPYPVGSLQRRRAIVEGRPIHGFECTIAVSDLEAVTDAAKAAGGRIVMDPYSIPGVGTLIFVEDTEGNIVGAMHYDRTTGS